MSLTETIALGLLGALAALGLIRLFSVPLRLALRQALPFATRNFTK